MDCSGHSHSPSSWSSCSRFSLSSCNSSSCLVSICSFSASSSCIRHNTIQHNFNHGVPTHSLAITSVCIGSASTQHNKTQSMIPKYIYAHPYRCTLQVRILTVSMYLCCGACTLQSWAATSDLQCVWLSVRQSPVQTCRSFL